MRRSLAWVLVPSLVVAVIGLTATGCAGPLTPSYVPDIKGRLLEPLDYVPPAEFEQAYHDRQTAPAGMAVLT